MRTEDPAAIAASFARIAGEGERARAESLRSPRGALLYRASRVLLRTSLSRVLGGRGPADWRFAPGRHGKPAIVGSPEAADFSLSRGQSVCAVAIHRDADVGLDIVGPVPGLRPSDLAPAFSTAELAACDGAPAALRLWVLKEAVAKLDQRGLLADLTAIGVATGVRGPRLAAVFRFDLCGDHLGACAQRHGRSPTTLWRARLRADGTPLFVGHPASGDTVMATLPPS